MARFIAAGRSVGRYDRDMAFERISVDTKVMGGVPCIRGTRIPVSSILGYLASGMTNDEILADFPQLALEDLRAALAFGAAAVSERELPYRQPA